MRDEKRIPRIMKLIEQYWKLYPDQRCGQMLINLGLCPDNNAIWNLEDDEIEKALIENFNKKKEAKK